MIIKPERKKGRLIIVTDSEEYDLTLYSSKPKYFYVADHADEHIDYLGTELSGCRDEITRLQAERDAMREQLRWSPSEDQIMAAITSSNCGLKRVKWKDGIDINLPSGEALSFVAAILEFRPKQDKGSDV